MPRQNAEIIAHWETSIRGGALTPRVLLDRIETALREQEIDRIHFSYIVRPERGLFSARRLYLRIRFDRLFFDVSAFVNGDGLTVSYWLHREWPGLEELFGEIPVIGFLIERAAGRATYYHVDRITALQRLVHESIGRIVADAALDKPGDVLPGPGNVAIRDDIW